MLFCNTVLTFLRQCKCLMSGLQFLLTTGRSNVAFLDMGEFYLCVSHAMQNSEPRLIINIMHNKPIQ